MREKRIVFITREGYRMAGARVRCYGFARILKSRGFETEVFSFADHMNAPFAEAEWSMTLAQRLSYSVRAFKALVRKERGTVFYIQRLHYHALAPFLISLLKDHPVVFDCDDWNIREEVRYHFGFFPSSKAEFLTRHFARYARVVVTASHYLENFLKPYTRKVCYIPTGVDTARFRPSPNAGSRKEIVLSWAGTVFDDEMYGNLLFLIECFRILSAHFPNTVLSLAGEGAGYERLKSALKEDPLRHRIRFEGWIDADSMPCYLSGVDIGLFPLVRPTRFNQAKSPTKLFEYMAMAKPVVASRIGEAVYIIKDGVSGFLAGSLEEFAQKSILLVQDVGMRSRIGLAARFGIEGNYSLDVLGVKLAEALS